MSHNFDYILLDPQTTDPVSPSEGSIWYNTTTDQLKLQTGAALVVLATTGGAGGGGLLQSKFAEQTVDTSTTSASWIDLLSIPITTQANNLILHTSVSLLTTSSGAAFNIRLTIDGVAVRGAQMWPSSSNYALGISIVARKLVAAGAHTVKLQWMVTTGTLRCRPATNPDDEHASLLVEEVSV